MTCRMQKRLPIALLIVALIAISVASFSLFSNSTTQLPVSSAIQLPASQVTLDHVAQLDIPRDPVRVTYRQGQTILYDITTKHFHGQWQEKVYDVRPEGSLIGVSLFLNGAQPEREVLVSLDSRSRVKNFFFPPDFSHSSRQKIESLYFMKQFMGADASSIQWLQKEEDLSGEHQARYTLVDSKQDRVTVLKQRLTSPQMETIFQLDPQQGLIIAVKGGVQFNLRSEFYDADIPNHDEQLAAGDEGIVHTQEDETIESLMMKVDALNFDRDVREVRIVFHQLVARMENHPDEIQTVKNLALSINERDPRFIQKVTLYVGAITSVQNAAAEEANNPTLAKNIETYFKERAAH